MTGRLAVPPAAEPVTLAEMRAVLGITQAGDTARDAVITSRIAAVRDLCEQYTERAFVTQTWINYSDKFSNIMNLKSDVISVASVKYIDTDGAQQVLDTSVYVVNLVNHRIELGYDQSWPEVRSQTNAVEIEYDCGYGGAVNVPQPIKEAIMFWVSQWENYQSGIEAGISIKTMPYAVAQILNNYRDFRGSF